MVRYMRTEREDVQMIFKMHPIVWFSLYFLIADISSVKLV